MGSMASFRTCTKIRPVGQGKGYEQLIICKNATTFNVTALAQGSMQSKNRFLIEGRKDDILCCAYYCALILNLFVKCAKFNLPLGPCLAAHDCSLERERARERDRERDQQQRERRDSGGGAFFEWSRVGPGRRSATTLQYVDKTRYTPCVDYYCHIHAC